MEDKEFNFDEELISSVLAHFMKERDIEKMAIMICLKENNTVDIDILGGRKVFKIFSKGD